MGRAREIADDNFIAITISDALSEYPEALRTAWLDLAADRLYISAALADLASIYREGRNLANKTDQGLPIIEHGKDRYVDVAWLKKICPEQAARFVFLEQVFRDGLFRQAAELKKH